MYEYIKGKLASKLPSTAVVEANGIGYSITIPVSTYSALPGEGEAVTILTHYLVREDKVELFGFASEPERALFRKLISVSRVGGNLAVSILSQMSVSEFITVVATDNVKMLTNVSGVGKKSAERIILELRNKLDEIPVERAAAPRQVGLKQEGINALVSLGYNRAEAAGTVDGVLKLKNIKNLEILLRESFKILRGD